MFFVNAASCTLPCYGLDKLLLGQISFGLRGRCQEIDAMSSPIMSLKDSLIRSTYGQLRIVDGKSGATDQTPGWCS
jgi:hypothetical protein